MQALGAQLGPGHAHHAKEAEGETWLSFIGWVMEGWANYNKGGINGWEPPMKVPWPALPRGGRRAFSLGFLESQASARHAGGVQTPYALGLVVVGDSAATGHSSLHGKATGLLHCCQQFLVELLIGLIGWDVNPVKAGMSLG